MGFTFDIVVCRVMGIFHPLQLFSSPIFALFTLLPQFLLPLSIVVSGHACSPLPHDFDVG
jgi:hypothetical protein